MQNIIFQSERLFACAALGLAAASTGAHFWPLRRRFALRSAAASLILGASRGFFRLHTILHRRTLHDAARDGAVSARLLSTLHVRNAANYMPSDFLPRPHAFRR